MNRFIACILSKEKSAGSFYIFFSSNCFLYLLLRWYIVDYRWLGLSYVIENSDCVLAHMVATDKANQKHTTGDYRLQSTR